ncbi:hypothetical protein LTR78_003672 [Recurvomyces mirabilis]|uniref:UFSP1/2/DUB catalytic domain-containing protein n=1 Tax=Recurvomyces mirabilis TaxID=574656 RepID=A0AAE0WR54_9PEZI|nr:hypothetical protein LTR78_003672 [Recurvomyces mirabilis]KAK5154784.1 hypothetical protein LTS14_006365 [Recurvomyces mirabilis]
MVEATCPFCGVTSPEPLVIEAHVEENHAENLGLSSQRHGHDAVDRRCNAVGQEFASEDCQFIKCTRPGCGEYVLLADVDEHMAVHESMTGSDNSTSMRSVSAKTEEQLAKSDPGRQAKLQKSRSRRPKPQPASSAPTLLEYFSGSSTLGGSQSKKSKVVPPPGRLGRRELGPHAFEKRMPDQVRRHLLEDGKPRHINKIGADGKLSRQSVIENETAGLIPILASLCARDAENEVTYLCHPGVNHIQDSIEQAWDDGILAHGRRETGGISGTRKWIGTSEAAAYFTQIGISVEAHSFKDETHELAVVGLLDFVEAHFISGVEASENRGSSRLTQRSSLYFQRFGHSMTIVGLERRTDGSRSLLVFDPSFETSAGMLSLVAGRRSRAELDTLLKAYRKTDQSLAKWEEFEILVPRSDAP